MIIMLVRYSQNPKPIEGVDYYVEPVPFFKKNREKLEKAKAEAEKVQEVAEDVHKD